MYYLKKFKQHSDYEEYINNEEALLSNVSFCEEWRDVHYNPYEDPYDGHKYVEIAGVRWSTVNLGAESETEPGLFFQYGDTEGYQKDNVGNEDGQKPFAMADYKFYNPITEQFTKYNELDGKTVLDESDDAVVAMWGGKWRMPTKEEFAALGESVDVEFTDNYKCSGISGYILTDKEDSSKTLFFPGAGTAGFYGRPVVGDAPCGYYATTSLSDVADHFITTAAIFTENSVEWNNLLDCPRYYGWSVRPVAD